MSKSLDGIHVTGKASLSGEIFIQGSKNAALPMIAASLMHRGLSILRGCPRISDVFCMEEILKSLGAVTWWDDHDLYPVSYTHLHCREHAGHGNHNLTGLV